MWNLIPGSNGSMMSVHAECEKCTFSVLAVMYFLSGTVNVIPTGKYPDGLMSIQATVLLGVCLVGLITIGLLYVGRCPVRLLSIWVTVRWGYCLSGKCPSGNCLSGRCPRGSMRLASVRSGYCSDILQVTQSDPRRVWFFFKKSWNNLS